MSRPPLSPGARNAAKVRPRGIPGRAPHPRVEHTLDSGTWTEQFETPATPKERLRLALELRGHDAMWLYRQLGKPDGPRVGNPDARGLVGAYSTIARYLAPPDAAEKSDPPLDVLQAAADALDFRVEWMVLGNGEPTIAGEEARSRTRQQQRDDPVLDTIRSVFPYIDDSWGWRNGAVREAHEAIVAYARAFPRPNQSDDDAQMRVDEAARLGRALMAPLEALRLGAERGAELDVRDLQEYVVLLTRAIKMAATVHPPGTD